MHTQCTTLRQPLRLASMARVARSDRLNLALSAPSPVDCVPCSDRQELGYHPERVLAGSRLDGNIPMQFAAQIVKLMNRKRIHANGHAR